MLCCDGNGIEKEGIIIKAFSYSQSVLDSYAMEYTIFIQNTSVYQPVVSPHSMRPPLQAVNIMSKHYNMSVFNIHVCHNTLNAIINKKRDI